MLLPCALLMYFQENNLMIIDLALITEAKPKIALDYKIKGIEEHVKKNKDENIHK